MVDIHKSHASYDLGGIKLLVVDDDVGLANSIKYFFEDLNCEVYVGYSGEGGLQLFLKEKPDLVIVDLNMPGMTGLEVIQFLTKNYQDTPIVVASGTGIIKEAIRSLKLGAWDFVTKPILNFEELEMCVLKALEKAQLLKENRDYKENLERLVQERTVDLEKKSSQLEQTIVELEHSKEKLIAADKLKTEFLAQISHEIRTPLNILLGYSEVLRMEFEENLSSNFETHYEIVKKASLRIIRTIELILQISELVSGNYHAIQTEVELNETVEEVFNKHYRNAFGKGLAAILNLPEQKLFWKLDVFSFTEALNQLIDNAVKFTDAGNITVSLKEEGTRITISVSDTGIGISEEYLSKLYESFSQEDQGYSRGYDGNGLGLALAKKYCEINGINITARSKKGVGTTFEIIFE